MGQHAMTDTAACVASAAHGAQTQVASAAPPPSDPPAPDPSYVQVAARQSEAPNN
jgi:hypothetical protein